MSPSVRTFSSSATLRFGSGTFRLTSSPSTCRQNCGLLVDRERASSSLGRSHPSRILRSSPAGRLQEEEARVEGEA